MRIGISQIVGAAIDVARRYHGPQLRVLKSIFHFSHERGGEAEFRSRVQVSSLNEVFLSENFPDGRA